VKNKLNNLQKISKIKTSKDKRQAAASIFLPYHFLIPAQKEIFDFI